MTDITDTVLSAEEIDDVAQTLRDCLPDDSCKAQLGLLIYSYVLHQREMITLLTDLLIALYSKGNDGIDPEERQMIETLVG